MVKTLSHASYSKEWLIFRDSALFNRHLFMPPLHSVAYGLEDTIL